MTGRRPNREPFEAIEVGIRRLRLVGLAVLGLALLLPGGHRPDPVGYGILTALAGLVLLANRTSVQLDAGPGSPETLVALQVGIDVTATVGALLVLDPGPADGTWLIVALPVVEGALRYGLIGGIAVWLTTATPLLGWAILGWSPGDGVATMTESGGVLTVALALGLPAGLAADHLADEWRSRTLERLYLDQQATHLAVLAVAAEELAGADGPKAHQTLVEATVALGFPGAELATVDTTSGHHHPLATEPVGYATSALAGPDLAGFLAATPGTTKVGGQAEAMALLCRDATTVTVLAAGPEDGEGRPDRHEAFAALSSYGASSLAAIAHRRSIVEAATEQEQQRVLDPRTGLLNRAGFEAAIASMLGRLVPGGELRLYAIDVEGFSGFVATDGRIVSDPIAREIGARLTRTSPPGAAVARLDVDRFAVATDSSTVPSLAEHLPDILARPIVTEAGPVTLRAVVGQLITPDPSTPPLVAIEDAQARAASRGSTR